MGVVDVGLEGTIGATELRLDLGSGTSKYRSGDAFSGRVATLETMAKYLSAHSASDCAAPGIAGDCVPAAGSQSQGCSKALDHLEQLRGTETRDVDLKVAVGSCAEALRT